MSALDPVQLIRDTLELRGCTPRGSARSFMARCPAHEDRDPSLSVGSGSDGRALVHCFAGCATDDVLGELGLCLHDLFPDEFSGDLRTVRATIGPGRGEQLGLNGNHADPDDGPELAWQWADELKAPDEPDWIWSGYVAPGAITLLAGKPKSGKSTLACGLAEALTARTSRFLDRALRGCGVVYLSEEGAGTLKPKLTGRIRTLTRDGAWPPKLGDADHGRGRRGEQRMQDAANRLTASGLSASSVRNTFDPVRKICARAVRERLIADNPIVGLELKAPDGRRDWVDRPERVARALAALPERERGQWTIAFYAGLRAGEIQALRWSDIDFDRGVLRVEQSWDRKVGPIAPKSRAGRRRVPMSMLVRRELRELQLRSGRRGDELVSAAPRSGRSRRRRSTAAQSKRGRTLV